MTIASAAGSAIYSGATSAGLALDYFLPTSAVRGCAVAVFHGGGWRVGAKEAVHDRAAALAAAGFTAVAVQYRLLGTAPWPAPLEDARAALGWIRDNAELLGIDPRRVVAQGHSAGAHIALMTGTLGLDERPAAVAAFYPPIGFHAAAPPPPPEPGAIPVPELDELGRVPGWMLLPPDATQADLDAASPIELLDGQFPPTIIVHGTADRMVDTRSSVALHRRLVELGVASELHFYAGRDHEFDRAPSMSAATVAATASFLDRTVLHPEESRAEAALYGFPPAI